MSSGGVLKLNNIVLNPPEKGNGRVKGKSVRHKNRSGDVRFVYCVADDIISRAICMPISAAKFRNARISYNRIPISLCGRLRACKADPSRTAASTLADVAGSKLSEMITRLSAQRSIITGPSSVSICTLDTGQLVPLHAAAGCAAAV